MHPLIPAFAASLALATPALADIETVTADGPVGEVMDRLETTITDAGATVFGRVDHAAGAESAGMELDDSQVLIFGNAELGTLAMQEDPRAGLFLPMKMLVYSRDGKTHIAWQEADEIFDDLDMDDDAEYLDKMEKALAKFAKTAAGTP